MKLLCLAVTLTISGFVNAQTLTLDGAKLGREISVTQFNESKKLGLSGSDWSIDSFSIFVDLFGREVEVASASSEITEEMYEAIEMLKKHGEAPLSFRFDNIIIEHQGLTREMTPVTVALK